MKSAKQEPTSSIPIEQHNGKTQLCVRSSKPPNTTGEMMPAIPNLPAPLTLERTQATLRRISGTDVTISALHAGTTWTDRARQAKSYRSGRVLLAGDAAHIHSPLGGQGLNLGVGDAMNLGCKLAATIHGSAPNGLLDSYGTERHSIGADVLNWSRVQVAIMRPAPPARALNAIMRDLIDTRDGATYVAARIWGIFTHYDLGGAHPLTGYSIPNFEFNDGTTIGDRPRSQGSRNRAIFLCSKSRAQKDRAALSAFDQDRIVR
jgi:2-polyprenyl-6-methoxyphenol hydroxylase-like FAD-dependent oxidoreductase